MSGLEGRVEETRSFSAGVWSLFEQSIIGAFHRVSAKHIDRYLDELEWRFSNRDNDHIFVHTLRRIANTEQLTYQKLVA